MEVTFLLELLMWTALHWQESVVHSCNVCMYGCLRLAPLLHVSCAIADYGVLVYKPRAGERRTVKLNMF